MNKFDEIISDCEFVMKHAKHVQINEKEIQNFAENFSIQKQTHWLSSNPFGLLDFPIEDIINFLIIMGSIDCSFWGNPKWTLTTKEDTKINGAYALIYALVTIKKEKGHLDFERINFEEFRKVFTGNVEIPLLKERYKVVNEVSKIINSKMNGNFYEFIKNIVDDIELFNIIIDNFPSFKDVRTYQGKTITFYKLAQLVVSDILHIRELKENIVVDYSNLVGCADYKIPQSLRNINILEYDEELANFVDNQLEIEENSIYEVEIRASMIVAINKIKKELNDEVSAIDLNDILWGIGKDKIKQFKPYHLTRTMSY